MTIHWQRTPRWVAFVCAAVLSLGALFASGAQADKGQGNGGNRAVGPTVTAVTPNTGPAAGGTVVTISGTNFSPVAGATSVKFGANPATNVSCTSATTCLATSPAGMNRTDVTVTVNGQNVTVKGTTLEQQPTQTLGGGLNSSLTVALPGGALVPGASVSVQFVLGVQQAGSFRFLVNVEALP
jgi:hypothetical protein